MEEEGICEFLITRTSKPQFTPARPMNADQRIAALNCWISCHRDCFSVAGGREEERDSMDPPIVVLDFSFFLSFGFSISDSSLVLRFFSLLCSPDAFRDVLQVGERGLNKFYRCLRIMHAFELSFPSTGIGSLFSKK